MSDPIVIYRDFPIINGYVQVEPCFVQEKTTVTPQEYLAGVSNSSLIVGMAPQTTPNTGSSFGNQQFVRTQGQTFDINV